MRSSEATGSISSACQRRPWLQWLVVVAIPMVYFMIHKLASLSVILNSLATREEDRTTANQVKGVLLGMLEDFIVTVLLVVSLVLVELASLGCSRVMLWAGADEHFHTWMILRAVGHFTRFAAVFALVAITLAPFSLDMALLRAQKTRLSTDQPSARDQLHARNTAQRDSDFDAMVGVTLVALAFTVLFVWLIDLLHWWPTHVATALQVEPISRGLSFSTPTYMDIRFEPYRVLQMDLEAGKPKSDSCDEGTYASSRHTTIVSAPCELYGDDEAAPPSHARDETWRDKLLDPRLRIVLVALAVLGLFMLLANVTRATSQLASPVVAGIALNASLNELVHGLFQVQFLPGTV